MIEKILKTSNFNLENFQKIQLVFEDLDYIIQHFLLTKFGVELYFKVHNIVFKERDGTLK